MLFIKMGGGFILFGPRYIIRMTNTDDCFCLSFSSKINLEIEELFFTKNGRISKNDFEKLVSSLNEPCISDKKYYEYEIKSNKHQYCIYYPGFKFELKMNDSQIDYDIVNNFQKYEVFSKLGHSNKFYYSLFD